MNFENILPLKKENISSICKSRDNVLLLVTSHSSGNDLLVEHVSHPGEGPIKPKTMQGAGRVQLRILKQGCPAPQYHLLTLCLEGGQGWARNHPCLHKRSRKLELR